MFKYNMIEYNENQGPKEVFRFDPDGKIFIRGVFVADDKNVFNRLCKVLSDVTDVMTGIPVGDPLCCSISKGDGNVVVFNTNVDGEILKFTYDKMFIKEKETDDPHEVYRAFFNDWLPAMDGIRPPVMN